MSTALIVKEYTTHTYAGSPIRERESDGWISLTDMAKSSGKEFHDWARLGRTSAFLAALSSNTGIPVLELTDVKVGGDYSGTWAHPRVAIDFAYWCSPEFAVFVTEIVYEHQRKGYTLNANKIASLDSHALSQLLIEAGTMIANRDMIIREKEQVIDVLAPKAEFHDDVMASHGWLSIEAVAEMLSRDHHNMGRNRLFAILRDDSRKLKALGIDAPFRYSYCGDRRVMVVRQEHINAGRFFVRMGKYPNSSVVYAKIEASTKGVDYIRSLLLKLNPAMEVMH